MLAQHAVGDDAALRPDPAGHPAAEVEQHVRLTLERIVERVRPVDLQPVERDDAQARISPAFGLGGGSGRGGGNGANRAGGEQRAPGQARGPIPLDGGRRRPFMEASDARMAAGRVDPDWPATLYVVFRISQC